MDRTKAVRPTSDGVAFIVKAGESVRDCFMSREAINTLSRLKNIDGSDAEPIELFTVLEPFVRPLAQSRCIRTGTDSPIHITPEDISSAFEMMPSQVT
ncbi:hypothetical protein [Noviherbaspirillum malthae]|uniref:hypothetical protein n=1 Tax=Noviherbaspirillum malthae TaxID=1260987 RepID=UPI00188F07A6|nr:hypothetical protein [Noviherbaspirillum malthae]